MALFMPAIRKGARRVMRLSPFHAASITALLILGTSVNVALLSLADGVLFRKLPYADAPRLFTVGSWTLSGAATTAVSRRHFDGLGTLRIFDGITLLSEGEGGTLQTAAGDKLVGVVFALPNFLSVLGMQTAQGAGFSRLSGDAAPEAILSWSAWQQRFGGDASIVGQLIRLNGSAYTVVGILPRTFVFPLTTELPPEVILPRILSEQSGEGEIVVGPIVRLRKGVSPEQAGLQLGAAFSGADGKTPNRMALRRLTYAPLALPAGAIWWLVIASVAVICAVAVNLAGLLEFGCWRRRADIATAVHLGARPRHIAVEVLAEAAVLTAGACILGPFAASWFTSLTLDHLQIHYSVQWPKSDPIRQWVYACLSPLVTGLAAAGLVLYRLRHYVTPASGAATPGGFRGRRLVMPQVAGSVFAVLAASGMVQNVAGLTAVNLGYTPDRCLVFSVRFPGARNPERRQQLRAALLERLRSSSVVADAGLLSALPMAGALPNGRIETGNVSVDEWAVSAGALPAFGTRFLQGQDFDVRDASGKSGEAVVDAAAARALFGHAEAAVGKTLRDSEGNGRTVIGVVERMLPSYTSTAAPAVYVSGRWREYSTSDVVVLRWLGERPPTFSYLEDIAKGVDRQIAITPPIRLSTLLSRGLTSTRFPATVLALAAGLGTLVSALGIYAAATHWAGAAQRDLALRLALGATPRSISVRGLVELTGIVVAGVAAGIASYVALSRVAGWGGIRLEAPSLSVGLVGIALLLLFVTAGAAFPLVRAGRTNPALLLRIR